MYFLNGRKLDSISNMTKFHRFSNLPNLPSEVAARPLPIYLSISGILELQIKQGQTCLKATIPGYNSYKKPSPNLGVSKKTDKPIKPKKPGKK
jgi:hypothetical protein